MSRYVLSPRAKADIEEIWDYTAAHWDLRQAETYIRQIQAAIELISAEPRLGRSCDAIRLGYRKYPAGANVIFFCIARNGVAVGASCISTWTSSGICECLKLSEERKMGSEF